MNYENEIHDLKVEREFLYFELEDKKEQIIELKKTITQTSSFANVECRWVSVEGKLPKNAKFVLGYSNLWSDCLIVYQCGGKFYDLRTEDLASQPTHWMELPEKPNVN